MASIWKNPRTKFLVACFTDAKGRRLKRSTGTIDKKLALKMAHQFEAESRSHRSAKQARRVLADIYGDLFGDDTISKTTRAFFAAFVESKKLVVSSASLDYYQGHARRFLEWLGPKADGNISEITKADIAGYRNNVAKTTGARTTNNTLKALKTFFSAAVKDGCLLENHAAGVETIRDTSESSRRPFTLEELRVIVKAAGDEWRSMILFGLYTGQRLGDIAALTWSNIDTENNEIRLKTRKTGRHQVLPLPDPLRAHIASLRAGDDAKAPLHPAAFAVIKKAGRASVLSKEFGQLLESAGLRGSQDIEAGNARAKHELSFHCLRHTATSLLKAAGIPSSVVMAYIGHDSADVSAGYTHTGKESLIKAAAALPSL